MRIIYILTGILILAFSISSSGQNLLNSPESVVFDVVNERYLVSNWAGGDIIAIDADENQTVFNSELDQVAGLHIYENTLYAASNLGINAGIIGIDLESGEIVISISIPNMDILNGITSDTSGFLYVTDWDDGGPYGNKIYQIDVSTEIVSTIVPYIYRPNGIEFDAVNNRLLVVSNEGTNDKLYAVNLNDFSLEFVTYLSWDSDGITKDNENYYYFSSWHNDMVYRFNSDFNSAEIICTGLNNPADIFFNLRDNVLAIPNYGSDEVTLITFPDSDEDGVIDINDNCINMPNLDQSDVDDDGVGDLCDVCPGANDNVDADGDGIPDFCDLCPGFDDLLDLDEDEFPNDCDNCPEHYNPGQEDSNGNDVGDPCDYICGDVDGLIEINILDIVYVLNYKYKDGPAPDPLESGDVNGDIRIDILDIVYLLNFKYKDGPEPECVVWK